MIMDTVPTKEEIKEFLKMHKKEWPRTKVAMAINVEKSSLDQCLSTREMSDSMRYEIAALVGMVEKPSIMPNKLNIDYSDDEFKEIQQASMRIGEEDIKEFIRMASIQRAREELKKANQTPDITPLSTQLHIIGSMAAGSGSLDESEDYIEVAGNYPEHYKGAKVIGDSMTSKEGLSIENGEIAIINTKWQGKPFPSNGKIYAFNADEGQVVKMFERRKVNGKTRGFLVSLNADYSPIPWDDDQMTVQGEFVETAKIFRS